MMPLAGAARSIESSLALSDAAKRHFGEAHVIEIAERANYRRSTSFATADPGAHLESTGERALWRVYNPGQQGALEPLHAALTSTGGASKRLLTEVQELRYLSRIVRHSVWPSLMLAGHLRTVSRAVRRRRGGEPARLCRD